MKIDLSTREGYDIAAAIRGPDEQDYAHDILKRIFTGRIRYAVGAMEGYVRSKNSMISWSDVHHIVNSKHLSAHFLWHIVDACVYLNENNLEQAARSLIHRTATVEKLYRLVN